jgi:PPE-repeat protein
MTIYTERLEKLKVANPTLRDCFDPYSSEYSETTIEQKIATLKKVIANDKPLSDLLKEYATFYTKQNKPHVVKDIHIGLKCLINFLLKQHTSFVLKQFAIFDQEELIFVLESLLQRPNEYDHKIKTILYKQLVQERRDYDFKSEDIVNPTSLKISNDEHLNAWAYWCGNLDADIILIGQDFGNDAYFINNDGKDEVGNPTNLNLQILFKQINIELHDTNEDNSNLKLYFTNAILGAKTNGGMAAQVKREWYATTAKKFTKRLIEIINPKTIIAMGSTALDVVSIIYELDKQTMTNAVANNPHLLPDNKNLYVVYHCSKLGQVNRRFEEQKKDWSNIKL